MATPNNVLSVSNSTVKGLFPNLENSKNNALKKELILIGLKSNNNLRNKYVYVITKPLHHG